MVPSRLRRCSVPCSLSFVVSVARSGPLVWAFVDVGAVWLKATLRDDRSTAKIYPYRKTSNVMI